MRVAWWLMFCFGIALFHQSEQNYGDWTLWTGCTSTCFETVQHRYRFCKENATCSAAFIIDNDTCNKDNCHSSNLVQTEIPCNASCGGYKTNVRNCSTPGKVLPEPCRNRVVTKCAPCSTATENPQTGYSPTATENPQTGYSPTATENPQTGYSPTTSSIEPIPQASDNSWIGIVAGVVGFVLVVVLIVVICVICRKKKARSQETKPRGSTNITAASDVQQTQQLRLESVSNYTEHYVPEKEGEYDELKGEVIANPSNSTSAQSKRSNKDEKSSKVSHTDVVYAAPKKTGKKKNRSKQDAEYNRLGQNGIQEAAYSDIDRSNGAEAAYDELEMENSDFDEDPYDEIDHLENNAYDNLDGKGKSKTVEPTYNEVGQPTIQNDSFKNAHKSSWHSGSSGGYDHIGAAVKDTLTTENEYDTTSGNHCLGHGPSTPGILAQEDAAYDRPRNNSALLVAEDENPYTAMSPQNSSKSGQHPYSDDVL